MCILTNVHKQPLKGNFCDEHGRAINLSPLKTTVGKWTMLTKRTEWLTAIQLSGEDGSEQRIIFHLLDLTVLNSYILLPFHGSQTDHQKFCLTLIQNLLEMNVREPRPQSSPSKSNDSSWSSTHQVLASCRIMCACATCSVKKKRMITKCLWLQRKVGLYRPMTFCVPYKSKLLNQSFITKSNEDLLRYEYCTFWFIYYTFSLV